MFCRIIALLAVAASVVSAEMIPTSPDGATVAKIGDQLTTLWTKDTSGEWNNGEWCIPFDTVSKRIVFCEVG